MSDKGMTWKMSMVRGGYVGCNDFQIPVGLFMRMSDIEHCRFAWLPVNFGRHHIVHHRVESVFSWDSVLVGAWRPLHSHTQNVAQNAATRHSVQAVPGDGG